MKKYCLSVLFLVGIFFCPATAFAASTDNYTITNYDVQMTLGRDGENRSTLKTIETITAQFPDYDQNHGLERVFVKEYNGHTTNLELISVTAKH